MFAYDIKLYLVNYNEDASLLQSDLNLFFNWCKNHFILLNIQKC